MDSGVDDRNDQTRRHLRRRGDDHDADVLVLDDLFERIHVIARNAVDGSPSFADLSLKRGLVFPVR